ncbi:uncharacterized protein YaeQ [Paucimonas lemoignei]|uniref:Uncharacterized protein YaeQ n=1 Tax=Paucimonas lemoignei TaxID=29443 RepID=A0A4R3HTN3_PAULE|nr:YaeQ family protein [Paucimonas lemoignei]TCS36527.1 uncharacterized protein YaeQ [Paucimonas lemoignei]
MALKATIFKTDLQVADMDRGYYGSHALTIARHPSETDERMMIRLLAFACHADPALSFGKGLSSDDEPDLWQKDLTGAIDLWIEVGQPDERRLLKASARSSKVVVYSYGNAATIWWKNTAAKLERVRNIVVFHVPSSSSQAMAKLAQRTMQLQCTIQDNQIWLTGTEDAVSVEVAMLRDVSI